jgi:hypothetical protein
MNAARMCGYGGGVVRGVFCVALFDGVRPCPPSLGTQGHIILPIGTHPTDRHSHADKGDQALDKKAKEKMPHNQKGKGAPQGRSNKIIPKL